MMSDKPRHSRLIDSSPPVPSPRMKLTYTQPPRISHFSGDPSSKDTPFDLWQFEVRSLLKDRQYEPDAIKTAVIKSLKGEAGRVAMRLGHSSSTRML